MKNSSKDQKDPTKDLCQVVIASHNLLESTPDTRRDAMEALVDNAASYLANGGSIDRLKMLEG